MTDLFRLITSVVLTLAVLTGPASAPLHAQTGDPVIEFRQSGGFAGRTYEVLLWPDGTIARGMVLNGTSARTTDRVPPTTVDQLVSGLLQAGFADFPDRFGPENACCDRFEYTITLRTDGVAKTVIVVDGADAPDALWVQIRELRGLLPLGQAQAILVGRGMA